MLSISPSASAKKPPRVPVWYATPRVFRVFVFTLSTLGVAYQKLGGHCGFMENASGTAKSQCSRELTHARAAVLAWSLLYIFRVVLYTFWLMALLALVAAACLASSVSAAATAAFISA